MKRMAWWAGAAAALALGSIAAANDSTAEMTAGGLVLRNSRNIDMLEEDLFVSVREIRVNYVFRNQGAADERVIVAFPMPDRDLRNENESDVAHVRDFVTTVEGRPVTTQVERRAFLGNREVTQLLARYGIPIAPAIPDEWDGSGERPPEPTRGAIQRLSAANRAALKRAGLIDYEEGSFPDTLQLLWTVRETYYWTQTFPAGRDLRIAHRYRPGAGSSAGVALAYSDFRASPEGRAMMRDYCVDQSFMTALNRMQSNGRFPQQQTVGYILRTGANWRSPIRSFRLVVDKGDPRYIVSFCGTGVRRISPTQFEVRHTNFRPTQDLRVLIAMPDD